MCPVYDNGIHPAHGCWSTDGFNVVALTAYRNGGNGNVDFGAIDTAANGIVIPGIGKAARLLGFAWNQSRNQH